MAGLRELGIVKKEPPTITRSTFHKLSLQEQAEFMRSGGRYEDDPAPAPRQLQKGEIRRSTFDAMDHAAKMAFIKNGGQLVDDAECLPLAAKSATVITRSEFRGMRMLEQIAFLDAGGTVTD